MLSVYNGCVYFLHKRYIGQLLLREQMDELDELRKKKIGEYAERYMKRGNNMEKSNWPNTPIELSDADMDENIKKYGTVVVDCWAPWCGPCRMVHPVVEELAQEMQGEVVFGKLNVDENRQTSMKYQIMAIPTLLVFKNAELVDKIVGAMPKQQLKAKLDPYK